MGPYRAVPDFFVEDLEAAKAFYLNVLGFEIGMEVDFMVTFVSGENRAVQLSIFTSDPSGFEPACSVEVDDVDVAHERALAGGCEIVYSLRDEPWGVRRFFTRDPSGAITNILSHKELKL